MDSAPGALSARSEIEKPGASNPKGFRPLFLYPDQLFRDPVRGHQEKKP